MFLYNLGALGYLGSILLSINVLTMSAKEASPLNWYTIAPEAMMEGYPCQIMDDVGVTMIHSHCAIIESSSCTAEIAQLGERQTEDLKVPGSIPGLGNFKKLTK